MEKLAQVIEVSKASGRSANSMTSGMGELLDEAVNALVTILYAYHDDLSEKDRLKLFKLWLENLPLRSDIEAELRAHHYLVEAFDDLSGVVFGTDDAMHQS